MAPTDGARLSYTEIRLLYMGDRLLYTKICLSYTGDRLSYAQISRILRLLVVCGHRLSYTEIATRVRRFACRIWRFLICMEIATVLSTAASK